MTMAESSPATETLVERRFVRSASPKTYGGPLTAPRTTDEANALLSRVEQFLHRGQATSDLLADLARFLGGNSQAWTPANRARLRRALASVEGSGAIHAIVATLQRFPRTDVLDEAELVFRALPPESMNSLKRLVEERALEPAARVCLLRGLARSGHGPADVVYAALNDPEPQLRDSAASLLAELGLGSARIHLQRRLERESNEMVRASIEEALASLSA